MDIQVKELKHIVETNPEVRIIDVREPYEIQSSGKIAQAVNIPLGQLAKKIPPWDKAAPVYVICQSGGRSLSGQQILIQAGFKAVNVAGGTGAWIRSGYPTQV